MPFFTFSKVGIKFAKQEFIWMSYNKAKTLQTINKVQIIDWEKFAAALNLDKEVFVVYGSFLGLEYIIIYLGPRSLGCSAAYQKRSI